ncbi:anti-sigma factor [Ferruginibacter lapsinanis]|uniref:anti-sigma factor n=1 Tax=Ferruginibacter lapsinanis TaxID=563172 RepID=UPI001E44E6C4|nr:anti-sigma factor [Ferruginibacter lapsinanis]UEG49121.1 anti-sigma factor [Ferruginibacter lapsinanis]
MQVKDIISSGLLELYATGIASEEEILQVEQWAKQYPEVAAELAEIQIGMEAYAAAHAIAPAADVKEKIFSQIASKHNNDIGGGGRVVGITPFWKYAAAASAILLFGSLALNIILINKNSSTKRSLQETQQTLAGLQQQNEDMKKDMHVVQDKYSMPVSLNPMPGMDAAAKVFWMKNTGEVYIDPSNLPDAPEGKNYQFWAIVDGKPVSGGMILINKKGEKFRIQKMKSFGKAEAFAVTLEDGMDSPVPKGPMYVMGKM